MQPATCRRVRTLGRRLCIQRRNSPAAHFRAWASSSRCACRRRRQADQRTTGRAQALVARGVVSRRGEGTLFVRETSLCGRWATSFTRGRMWGKEGILRSTVSYLRVCWARCAPVAECLSRREPRHSLVHPCSCIFLLLPSTCMSFLLRCSLGRRQGPLFARVQGAAVARSHQEGQAHVRERRSCDMEAERGPEGDVSAEGGSGVREGLQWWQGAREYCTVEYSTVL